jgi:hypothetical protein
VEELLESIISIRILIGLKEETDMETEEEIEEETEEETEQTDQIE